MPGKRPPADPREMNLSGKDAKPKQAGFQDGKQPRVGGGEWEKGEAPPENTYRETPAREGR